jgi:hypothetical protein
MFRSVKDARFVRIALLAAGVLVVTGSFGLHPEPEHLAPAAAGAGWNGPAGSLETNPHICFACLALRSVPLPRLSAVVLAPRATEPASAAATLSLLGRLDSHPREGRAPPSLA